MISGIRTVLQLLDIRVVSFPFPVVFSAVFSAVLSTLWTFLDWLSGITEPGSHVQYVVHD